MYDFIVSNVVLFCKLLFPLLELLFVTVCLLFAGVLLYNAHKGE